MDDKDYVRRGHRAGDDLGAPPRKVLLGLRDAFTAGKLAQNFSRMRVIPTLTFSCSQLLQQAKEESYALVVLDEAFVCDHRSRCLDELQELSTAPVMAVADLDEDKYPGVELAVKPYRDADEIARRGVALIDLSRPVALPQPIAWGDLELNMRTRQARWKGSAVALTTLQFRIMEVLILAAGAVVTSEELSRRVWGETTVDDHQRLTAHIRRIRRQIEPDPSRPQYLLRVRGAGFRLSEPSTGQHP